MNRRGQLFFTIIILVFISSYMFSFSKLKQNTENNFNKIPKGIKEINIKSFEYVKTKKLDEIKSLFVDDVEEEENFDEGLLSTVYFINEYGDLIDSKIIDYYVDTKVYKGRPIYVITYEKKCGENYLLYSTSSVYHENNYKLISIDATKLGESLTSFNSFKNKELKHYLFLFLVILNMILTFFTASYIFGKKEKRYIWWMLIVLSGMGEIHLNWGTGEFYYNILSMGVPSFGICKKTLYDVTILVIRIPMGAYFYWANRLNLRYGLK